MFCRHVFGNISGGFRGISRFLGEFRGISLVRYRARILETSNVVSGVRASCNIKQVSFFSFPCQNDETNLTVLFQNRCFIIP